MDPTLEIVAAACLGISLAACCGLRAFLPLLVAAVAARLGGDRLLAESFQWLASTPALVGLSVAVVLEVGGDKVPALDHVLDAIQGPVRTLCGILAAAAVAGADLPGWATAMIALTGGGVALSTHSAKAVLRLGATATTGGLANPLISFLEDLLALVVSVLSVLLTVLAIVFALLTLVILLLLARRLVRWWRRGPETKGPVAPP